VVSAALPLLPYALDIIAHSELVRLQLANPIVADKTSFGILTPLVNLLNEHKRLFRTIEIIPISVLFVLSLLPSFRNRSPESKLFYSYSVLLVVLHGMLTPDKLTRYGIVLFPFFAIAAAFAIRTMIARERSSDRRTLSSPLLSSLPSHFFNLFLAILVGYGLYYAGSTSFSKKEDVVALNRQIARVVPAGSRVVAPMNFLFNEIGNYHIIALRYANYQNSSRLTLDSLLAFAARHRADAILFNRYQAHDEGIIDLPEQRERLHRLYRTIEEPNGAYMVVHLGENTEERNRKPE
jgi:hypothetical protein